MKTGIKEKRKDVLQFTAAVQITRHHYETDKLKTSLPPLSVPVYPLRFFEVILSEVRETKDDFTFHTTQCNYRATKQIS
jgi:hypothetical protein